jgi:hypothetical protein
MATATAEPACVEAGKCYPLSVFSRIVGLGRHGMRTARRNGLRVIHAHGTAYVLGDDWLKYIATIAPQSDA